MSRGVASEGPNLSNNKRMDGNLQGNNEPSGNHAVAN